MTNQSQNQNQSSEAQNELDDMMKNVPVPAVGSDGKRPKLTRLRVREEEVGTSTADKIAITIHTTIVDRLAGVTDVEPVWRKEVSATYLSRLLEDEVTRKEVSSYFLSLATASTVEACVKTRTVKKEDRSLLTQELAAAVNKTTSLRTVNARFAVIELLNAYLIRVGIIPESRSGFGNLAYHVYGSVTVEKLARDVLGQEVLRMVSKLDIVDLDKHTYTPSVFANEVALAMEPIGRALSDSHEMNSIVKDIVLGVRARLDTELTGMHGHCPQVWRDSVAVTEASRNYVFVRAALELPQGTNMTPTNSEYRLDKYGSVVWGALKLSTRYKFVGREEAIRTRGLMHTRDVHGDIRHAIVWDAARPDAIAQVVQAENDARIPSAVRVTNERKRVSDSITTAYGNVAAMGTTAMVRNLALALRYKVEAEIEKRGDYYADSSSYACVVGDANAISMEELAALLCERLYADTNATRDALDATGSAQLWAHTLYVCQTRERWLPSGTILGDMFYTRQARDVFFAVPAFEPKAELASMPQVIPAHGMNCSLIGLDPNKRFTSLGKRVAFDFNIDNIKLSGALNANKLNMISTSDVMSLVKPMFNNDVLDATVEILSHIVDIASKTKRKNSAVASVVQNLAAASVLEFARATSDGYREQVSMAVRAQAGAKLTAGDAARLSGLVNDRAHAVTIETLAMHMFLKMQGLDAADEFLACANDSDVQNALPRVADLTARH